MVSEKAVVQELVALMLAHGITRAVLCPGTVIGRGSTVYPLVRVRGVIPEDRIVKSTGVIAPRR